MKALISDISLPEYITKVSKIATKAGEQAEQLINFIFKDNRLKLIGSDGVNIIEYEVQCKNNEPARFSVMAKDIDGILETEVTKITLSESTLLIEQSMGIIELPIYDSSLTELEEYEGFETLNLDELQTIINKFVPYLSSKSNELNVLVLNGKYAYVKDRLYYILSQFRTEGSYSFDNATCNLLKTILSSNSKQTVINLTQIEGYTKTLFQFRNCKLVVANVVHEDLDLNIFGTVKPIGGIIINKEPLIKSLIKINKFAGSNDVDLIYENKNLNIRPAIEGTKTSLRVPSSPVDPNDQLRFVYTVNLENLIKLIKNMRTKYLSLLHSNQNILLIVTEEEGLKTRYFINIY